MAKLTEAQRQTLEACMDWSAPFEIMHRRHDATGEIVCPRGLRNALGYLRNLGMVEYEPPNDTYRITEAGRDDLIERLRAATMRTDWNNLPDDACIPAVPLLRIAADALAAKGTAISEMRAELERVKAALEPFATYAGLPSFDRLPADMPLTPGSGMAARQVTVGDFRAAARALSQPDTGVTQ